MNDPLITGYNFGLVIVSVVIAILASYTAIYLAERVTATQSRVQLLWLLSGATAMGTGIWSMHFIGMLAFRLPVLVYYDFFTVCLSILPAIIASGLALFLVSRPIFGGLQLLGGSLFMGLGIVSMHYIGMAAMRTSAVMYYNPLLVTLSVVIAIAVSLIGLFFVFQLREETTSNQIWKKVIAAIIMGAAIPIMHYIGMAAAYFIPMSNTVLESELKPPENVVILAISVIIGTLIILGLALLTIFFDRRLSAQIIYSQAIKDSQKYLKTILQNIQSGVLVIEEDGQIKLFNQAVLDLLHLSNEAELQQLWDQAVISHVPAQDLDIYSIQTVLHKIASKQPVQNAVVSVQSSESEDPTVLLVNAISLTISTSSITQMICTLNDITELKLTEEKLKKSETQFRELARQEELLNYLSTQIRQSLELPIILQTAVSEVREIFETDRALIYKFNADWHGQVILEDLTAPWFPTIGEAADDCFPREYLERYRNGGIRAINNILDAGLDPDHLQFLQRLQVQANLIVPIVVSNQLWGLLIVHQCSRPRVWQEGEGNLLYRLAGQLGIAIQQSDLYSKSEQNTLQAQSQAQQLRESETRLKQQAQSLQQTLEELQNLQLQLVQSEKMSSLGQLVAGIAHEINNPVNFIHGNLLYLEQYTQDLFSFLQLYEEQYPNPTAEIQAKSEEIELEFLQEDLAKIITSMNIGTNRIRQIVLTLRNFSRMDEAEFKRVDIHEGIDSTLMILQYRLKKNSESSAIEVIREYANLPLVECYPGQLNQVFMNILTNAIDALEDVNKKRTLAQMQENPSQITIRTSIINGESVEIAIADNGSGIPEKVKTQIFDPFFTTKPIGKGTGLGMSISYQIIVEKHGGKLECLSNSPQGVIFVIQIPVQQGSSN